MLVCDTADMPKQRSNMEQLVRLRRAKLVVNIPRNSLLDRDKTSWKILVEREKKTWRQHPTYHAFTHTIYLLSQNNKIRPF